MKTLLCALPIFTAAMHLSAQGTVNFANADADAVWNNLTHAKVPPGNGFLAQLYYGPVGARERDLVAVTPPPIGFALAGRYIGAGRTLLESVIGTCYPDRGKEACVQVRVWQSSLGSSWEEAIQNAPVRQNEVFGASSLVTLPTGNPCEMPPGIPVTLAGSIGEIYLNPAQPVTPAPNGPGSALQFDGLTDHLTARPPRLPTGNSPYTIEAWINTTAMNVGTIAAWGNFRFNNQVNAFRLTPTGLVNYWWGNDLYVTLNLVGEWHHVAATFDGTTRRILVDGIIVGSDNPLGHDAGPVNFSIGSAGGGEFFSGTMDEVRIWNIGRSAAQIQADMRRQLFGNEEGLVVYYRLDEGAGSSASDATGDLESRADVLAGPSWVPSSIQPFAPPVSTLAAIVSPTNATSATLNGVADGRTSVTAGEFYFEWGTNTSLGHELRPGLVVSPGAPPRNFSVPLTGLVAGTTYHFRAVAVNGNGASYGATLTFRLPGVLTVMNANDTGAGSLRQALEDADPGEMVVFAPNIRGTLVLTNGELAVHYRLSIRGPGASELAISGNNRSRVLFIGPHGRVDISGLSITKGFSLGSDGGLRRSGMSAFGGGICNEGFLALIDCLIATNRAQGGRGGDGQFGGPAVNAARGGDAQGGAIYNAGALNLKGCTLLGNVAQGGNGGDGGYNEAFTSAGNGGSGGASQAGAIWSALSRSLLANCTLSDNDALGGYGGHPAIFKGAEGRFGDGGYASGGALLGSFILESCTIARNSAVAGTGNSSGIGEGGGLDISGLSTSCGNSLIAMNTASTTSPDVTGLLYSQGWNLVGIVGSSLGWTANDLVGSSSSPLDPLLGPCQDNGGAIWTMFPLPGSPARDNGKSDLPTDARGGRRGVDLQNIPNAAGGDGCDIGAMEVGSFTRLANVRTLGPQVNVSFTTDGPFNYYLESKDALAPGPWTLVPGSARLGNGVMLSVVDTRPRVPRRFYRVRADLPTWQLIYFNDFERLVGAEWNGNLALAVTPSDGRKFLGELGNAGATLELNGLLTHTRLKVSVDLFILKSWDGNRTDFGPDMFDLSVRGGAKLFQGTFSTYTTQSYPGSLSDNFPANTGAVEINTLGYTHPNLGPADAVYHFSLPFPHATPNVILDFRSLNLQDAADESWGLDNVRIEAINAP